MAYTLTLLCDKHDEVYKIGTKILGDSDFVQMSTYIYFCEGVFSQQDIKLLSDNNVKYKLDIEGS